MQFSYQLLLDEVQELALQLNKQNDALEFAIKQRGRDAAKISRLKEEYERIQQQAEKSEQITKTLMAKHSSSSNYNNQNSSSSSSSSAATTSLASLSVSDLLKKTATYLHKDDDDDEQVTTAHQNFRGLQKLSQQRNQQSSAASFALEHARANSFQARLHVVDRQKGKALESVVNLMNNNNSLTNNNHKTKTTTSSSSRSSSSFWGPRATTAFAAAPTSKKHLVNCDDVDDAFKQGVACWLDWCEGKLQECNNHNNKLDESTNDSDENDERRRISALFKSLLVASQFVVDDDANDVAFNLGLSCGEDLKLCKRIFSESQEEAFSVAERARIFFEEMTTTKTGEEKEFAWPKVI